MKQPRTLDYYQPPRQISSSGRLRFGAACMRISLAVLVFDKLGLPAIFWLIAKSGSYSQREWAYAVNDTLPWAVIIGAVFALLGGICGKEWSWGLFLLYVIAFVYLPSFGSV